MRAELLRALPASRPPKRGHRYLDVAYWLPLRRPRLGDGVPCRQRLRRDGRACRAAIAEPLAGARLEFRPRDRGRVILAHPRLLLRITFQHGPSVKPTPLRSAARDARAARRGA